MSSAHTMPRLGPDPEPLGIRRDGARDGGLGDRGALRVGSLGLTLAHRRLQHRARRLGVVLATLKERQARLGDDVSPGLRAAIADFGQELRAVQQQLREANALVEDDRAPTRA